MVLPTSRNNLALTILTNIGRFVLAAVLIISGFVKAVDPMGLSYKLSEYLSAFDIASIPDGWIKFTAMLLSAAEFITGVLLLAGVYKRVVTLVTFLFFLLFTPLTLILAIWNPVHDCGCFGDAIHLTNWETFGKNLILFIMATLTCLKHRLFRYRISRDNRWVIALFAISYIILVEAISLSHLPVIDFRPFAINKDLRQAVIDIPTERKTIYKFEKNGILQEFDDESYPDSTWNYLGSRDEILKEGKPAEILDFEFIDNETGEDYSEAILSDTGHVILLISEQLSTADESHVDKINSLYDLSIEHNIPFYAATSSEEDDILLWRKRTGAEYPILWADNIMLKTIIRSNPGVIMIKDGKIAAKWNTAQIPDIDKISAASPMQSLITSGYHKHIRGWRFWVLLFAVPMLLIAITDKATHRKTKSPENKTKNSDN